MKLTSLGFRSGGEDAKQRPPTGPEVLGPDGDHLVEALDDHIFGIEVPAMDHGVLERLQEVFLEFEVGQLVLLQESHRQLS
jgi:hypothetical protein